MSRKSVKVREALRQAGSRDIGSIEPRSREQLQPVELFTGQVVFVRILTTAPLSPRKRAIWARWAARS